MNLKMWSNGYDCIIAETSDEAVKMMEDHWNVDYEWACEVFTPGQDMSLFTLPMSRRITLLTQTESRSVQEWIDLCGPGFFAEANQWDGYAPAAALNETDEGMHK